MANWLLQLGDNFVWNGAGPLMNWHVPAATAAFYLAGCAAHNARLPRKQAPEAPSCTPLLDAISVLHNILLVAFSAVVSTATTYHFGAVVRRVGLYGYMCPHNTRPLGGGLHFWCYIFYVSKYYELVDTVLLIARRKRVIALHAGHHAFMPLTMCVLFDGRVSASLVGVGIVNAFVHVVMYSYYLASALHFAPAAAWKCWITRLQILQFATGALGGTYYWLLEVREPRLSTTWPLFSYTAGCDGGVPKIVMVGYVFNLALLVLFVRFYRQTYLRAARRKPAQGKTD